MSSAAASLGSDLQQGAPASFSRPRGTRLRSRVALWSSPILVLSGCVVVDGGGQHQAFGGGSSCIIGFQSE
ncbi:hypothetical protein RchiOBHm_Chr5g0082451 [Rosa chinensis]|uniref:Uncharacterized protein n=1 Tax=Rosa chinensis TaxID=74649 RepID=A0A2P6QNA9_ROSCH|nr:hypothetical protein RchiOBHm_Chr5g0082451 [Rosa chinensis]